MTSVICIDGPSGAGKGTISRAVADALGFDYLDSGALYRILAVISQRMGVATADIPALVDLAKKIRVVFRDDQVVYENEDISPAIRNEEIGARASELASIPEVRGALLELQRGCVSERGLVADGRDMGTVVFPDAKLKIFLNASPEERARRRYAQLIKRGDYRYVRSDANQLIHKGDGDSLRALVKDIELRDARDSNRDFSPLRPSMDAIEIDSTSLTVDEVVNQVISCWQKQLKET